MTWQLANGAVVGRTSLDYNAVGNYRCATGSWCWVKTSGGEAYLQL